MTPENPEYLRLQELILYEDYDPREKTPMELEHDYKRLFK